MSGYEEVSLTGSEGKEESMSVALFLTYNSVGDPGAYSNGVVERNGHKAIIIQHPRGKAWAVPQIHEKHVEIARQVISEMGGRITDISEDVEHVVVYVGDRGSEGAISLASRFPKEKLCFVLCSCNLANKRRLIQFQCNGAKETLCECGGQRTMGKLVEEFFRTGVVGPA